MVERSNVDVEYFAPTALHGESRSETLARVIHDAHLEDGPEGIDADITTASGGNRRIALRALVAMAVGALIGAAAGLVLSLAPGPLAVESGGGRVGYMLVLGGALAVIVGLVSTLLMLEREDGRMEREVEEHTGHAPPPPAG